MHPDALLLVGHQKIADAVMDWFGRSCFVLAEWCAKGGTLCVAAEVATDFLAGRLLLIAIDLWWMLVVSGDLGGLVSRARAAERARMSGRAIQPDPIAPMIRMVWAALFLLIVSDLPGAVLDGNGWQIWRHSVLAGFALGFTAARYFLACVPRPPRRKPARSPAWAALPEAV